MNYQLNFLKVDPDQIMLKQDKSISEKSFCNRKYVVKIRVESVFKLLQNRENHEYSLIF